jgi:hypothetical protein
MAKKKKRDAETLEEQPKAKAPVKSPELIKPPEQVAPSPPVVKKRERYVREKKEKRSEVEAAPLPPRSKKFFGKLMTKNLAIPPKDEQKPMR